jgi:hypothetical protein
MAVCWRCPDCDEVSCETEIQVAGQPLACDHCERAQIACQTRCVVCDSPNPWSRRDTIHFLCRCCGHVQTFYSHLASA